MADVWASGREYEGYIGRWSRLVAPRFLRLLPAAPHAAWCDVGCGTGALAQAVLATERPERVLGVDPSTGFLDAARQAVADRAFAVATGDAAAIPADDRSFDRVVSGLVLNFVPDVPAALAEMRRVTRPRGVVAGYVWDYAERMELLRAFWDVAVALDPDAAVLDEAARFPLCRPDPLRAAFAAGGLTDVVVDAVEVPTVFEDFDDLWRPFLGGQGPAPGYCARLPQHRRDALRERLRERLPARPDGSIVLAARAWAVRGVVPGR